jgi:hypothetical protein
MMRVTGTIDADNHAPVAASAGPVLNAARPKVARILFIHPGPVPPNANPRKNLLYHLSRHFEGDLLTQRWRLPEDDQRPQVPVQFEGRLGDFGYHALRLRNVPALIQTVWTLLFFVGTCVKRSWVGPRYDVVVAYGLYAQGMAAWALSRLSGAKLIIDVLGHPFASYDYSSGWLPRIKKQVAKLLAPALLKRADAIKLLHPTQLDELHLPRRALPPITVFPDFVAVTAMKDPSGIRR